MSHENFGKRKKYCIEQSNEKLNHTKTRRRESLFLKVRSTCSVGSIAVFVLGRNGLYLRRISVRSSAVKEREQGGCERTCAARGVLCVCALVLCVIALALRIGGRVLCVLCVRLRGSSVLLFC